MARGFDDGEQLARRRAWRALLIVTLGCLLATTEACGKRVEGIGRPTPGGGAVGGVGVGASGGSDGGGSGGVGATTGGGGSGGGTAGSAGGGTGGNTASCDVANDYDAQNPPPTAWYRFENASGPVVDEAGTFDGVIDGNLSRDAVGRCGGSATFNGGRVIVPSDPSLNPGAGAGGGTTIEAWVNPTIGGNATIAARGTGNNDDNVIVGMTDCGAIQVIFSRAGASSTSLLSGCAQLTTQEWHHVAVVHDGASLTIYVDGVPAKQAAGSDLGPVDAPLVLGGRESGVFPYVGRLDEVKWWNTARSAAEVCRDAGGTFSGTCAL